MRQLILEFFRMLKTAAYMVPVVWRHLNGRWYVFRDAPMWLVLEIAGTPIEKEDSVEIASLIREARKELCTRMTKDIDEFRRKDLPPAIQAEAVEMMERDRELVMQKLEANDER